MTSRTDKYFESETNNIDSTFSTRSSRNSRLYKEVYGRYGDLDNLPVEDNTDEIDMERLRELLSNPEQKKEETEIRENMNILEQRKRQIDEQKVYDINKILEKAKYENHKLKEPNIPSYKVDRNILSTLQSSELSLDEIKQAKLDYEQQLKEKEDKLEKELSMTREIKYQNLSSSLPEEEVIENKTKREDNDLSLDLFSDLKPTGNTIVTKPIQDPDFSMPLVSHEKTEFHSEDTSDIDIIKPAIQPNTNMVESDFFTSSYEFTKNDFATDDDFADLKPKGGIFKIILLILAIIVFIGVIIYFVATYGLGMDLKDILP